LHFVSALKYCPLQQNIILAFTWDEHNGMAFAVDKDRTKAKSKLVRELLTEFFNTYKGKLIWHNAGYFTSIP
jgi:hypothetical protein